MERLTFEGNFCDIAQCYLLPCKYDNNCTQKQVWERLKQYEGTGLTPEEFAAYWVFIQDLIGGQKASEALSHLREFDRANKEGRVVVLPCIRYCEQYGWQNITWDNKYGICAGSHDTREEADRALEGKRNA